jgi:hypothetical protein
MVLHMYNNRASETAKQDVTCGIGILLISRDTATAPDYKFMFYDPATKGQPTDELLRADWDAASKLLPILSKCQPREYPGGRWLRRRVQDAHASGRGDRQDGGRAKGKLKSELENWLPLETFISMPSQAQVACVSYFYGWSLAKAPNFRQALLNLDFTRAAKESKLAGAAQAKNKAHERLFLNAASIWDAVGNGWEGDLFQVLPQKVAPPEIMIYSAQTITR